jgi:hypothetical protein
MEARSISMLSKLAFMEFMSDCDDRRKQTGFHTEDGIWHTGEWMRSHDRAAISQWIHVSSANHYPRPLRVAGRIL